MPVAITGSAFNRASATFFGWVRQRSQARRRRNGFAYCDSYEIERIAKDVGLTTMELSRLAQFGPNAARLLLDRMAAQNLDVETISKIDPSTMRDLQRLCSICSTKKRSQVQSCRSGVATILSEFWNDCRAARRTCKIQGRLDSNLVRSGRHLRPSARCLWSAAFLRSGFPTF
jgi:hypothetical protein